MISCRLKTGSHKKKMRLQALIKSGLKVPLMVKPAQRQP